MSHPSKTAPPPGLNPRLAAVRLLALDVDGVLTDGRVVYLGDQEGQFFDVKDGAGLAAIRQSGVSVVWITGRGCGATRRRAEEFGARLLSEVKDKLVALEGVQAELGVGVDETLAMGDDLPDLAMAPRATAFVAPADAVPQVRDQADWVTSACGGRGAVREVCDALLAARDQAGDPGE